MWYKSNRINNYLKGHLSLTVQIEQLTNTKYTVKIKQLVTECCLKE